MTLDTPHESAGAAPIRPANSIRRTSTIDTNWPEGHGSAMHMVGVARDIYTKVSGGEGLVCGAGSFEICASPQREILSIEVSPQETDIDSLIGVRAGGQSRAAINEIFSRDDRMSPLYLLVDDFAGASLVAGWAWSRWRDQWGEDVKKNQVKNGKVWVMEGICAGFRPGASSLNPDGTARHDNQSSAPTVSLVNPKDTHGWHQLEDQQGVGMRRARWIDVWVKGDSVGVEAGFQDSATDPSGTRRAVHEYRISARASAQDMILTDIEAQPLVLPYAECPAAAQNIQRLIGSPLENMRQIVLDKLPGTMGCTHLNDVLRGLADIPELVTKLEGHNDQAY